eukprot:jgi/Botrbrau1/16787/Bobra.150_2s0017.1
MTALMGPSGAGKSTLLDILAMRLQPTSGTVLANGRRRTAGFRSISAYVPQEAHFVPTLTVGETLMLHARLRLPRSLGRQYKEVIEDTLTCMGLLKSERTQVGGDLPGGLFLRGISGGELRRLHIACGIVAAPSIIFVDEPTSGLDSHASLVLMEHLKSLAMEGRTVLCSIHQPRQQIWDMFDFVTLISEGFLIFYGRPFDAVPWFEEMHGFEYNPQTCGASSDWLLDQVSVHFHHSISGKQGFNSKSDLQRAASLLSAQSPLLQNLEQEGSRPISRIASREDVSGSVPFASGGNETGFDLQLDKESNSYPTSFFNQLPVLCWRSFLQYIRNPADASLRIFVMAMVGTFLGIFFLNTYGPDGYIDYLTLFGMIFLMLQTLVLHPMTLITLLAADRRQFLVDLPSHIYGPCAWFLSQTLMAAPFVLFSALVMLLLPYGIVGMLATPRAILTFVAAGCITNLIGNALAVLAVHLTSNQDAAMLITIAYNTCALLLGGFFIPLPRVPAAIRWLSYGTPLRYAFGSIASEQLRFTKYAAVLEKYSMDWALGSYFAGLLTIYVVLLACNLASLYVLRTLKSFR